MTSTGVLSQWFTWHLELAYPQHRTMCRVLVTVSSMVDRLQDTDPKIIRNRVIQFDSKEALLDTYISMRNIIRCSSVAQEDFSKSRIRLHGFNQRFLCPHLIGFLTKLSLSVVLILFKKCPALQVIVLQLLRQGRPCSSE